MSIQKRIEKLKLDGRRVVADTAFVFNFAIDTVLEIIRDEVSGIPEPCYWCTENKKGLCPDGGFMANATEGICPKLALTRILDWKKPEMVKL